MDTTITTQKGKLLHIKYFFLLQVVYPGLQKGSSSLIDTDSFCGGQNQNSFNFAAYNECHKTEDTKDN